MRKRFLSWLLVLTMVVSLIPSTLGTTALAADDPSAQASGQAGKTTVKLDNKWPDDMSADITDVLITGTTIPGPTLTVEKGKTLIVHGSGTLSGSGRTQHTPFFIVEDGGHLVLDNVTITANVAAQGTVVVKKGGLLDLGYNDQKDRIAPSITGNTTSATLYGKARNLVVEDGATVRLNAAATKKIGVSQVEVKDYSTPQNTQSASYIPGMKPLSVIQGGRYTIADSDLTNVTADVSERYEKLVLSHDNLILRSPKPKVLNWSPDDFMGVGGGYGSTTSYTHGWWIRAYLAMTADAPDNTAGDSSKTPNMMQVYGYRDYRSHTSDATYLRAPLSNAGDLPQYDVIYINFPFSCIEGKAYYDEEVKLLQDYLNSGGRVVIQGENTEGNYGVANTRASVLASHLGAGFDLLNEAIGTVNVTTEANTNLGKGISSVAGQGLKTGNASTIRSNGKADYTTIAYVTLNGEQRDVIVDQQAGTTAEKWGSLTVIADADMVRRGHSADAAVEQFYRNLLDDSVERRNMAAAGFNPNKKIEKQATTTTTTETKEYATPYAALQKAVETNTVTLLTHSNAALTPTRDELLFEQSTLAYEANSKYAGSTIHADTAGVYLDITKTGEVNVMGGQVTVHPDNANYVLRMNGTMDEAGMQITGGYQIKSADNYTLTVEDATSPISAENGGTASVKASKAGQVFTVVEPGGETVTYNAKDKDEVIYLGRYRVIYAQNSTAEYTPNPKPTYGSTFKQLFTPATGYEMNGGSFRTDLWDEAAKDWKTINVTASADSEPGVKSVWKSDDGKVVIEQTYSKTGLSTGVTVTVNDVKEDIKIYTVGDAMIETNPNITLRGVGTDKDGTPLTDPLYELPTTMSYKDGVTTKPIESIPWEKYKLVGVKVGLTDGTLVEQDLTDANGNKDAAETLKTYTMLDLTQGSEIIVEFQYAWNWVDVTVKAVLNDGNDTPFPGFVPEIVEMEADKLGTVKAPNISGYEPNKTSEQFTPSKTNPDQNVVTFKYTQALSKVIYKAVNEQGHELGTFDGPTIARGERPNLSAALAPKLTGYMVKTDSSGAKLDGVPSSDKPFDGTTPITVTFTYVPRVKTVKVYMYEYDASKPDFKGTSLKFDETTYANMTTGQTLTISASAIAGYTVKEDANNEELRKTKSVFVSDDDTQQTVNFFYEKDTASQKYITVKLMDTSKNPNALIFSYKVPGIAGQAQVISAPTTLDGYVADGTNADVTIKPEEDRGDGEGVVVFKFKPDVWTVTVKLMDNSTKPAAEIAAKPTNFQDTYTVTKGKEISITAPSIYGYTLALDGQDNDLNGGTLKFTPTSDTEKAIYYVPIAQEMVNIQVTGKVDGGNDLYTYTVQAAAGTGTYTIDAKKSIPGYTLAGATIGSDDVLGQITNDKLNVPVPANVKGGTVAVTLTYKSTKTTVTVKTSCDGTDLSTTYPVEKEIGQETSVVAPSIPGYTATEQIKTLTPQGNDVVTFEYTKNTGNVVLIAKAGNTELFRKDGGTKANGDTVNVSNFKAPDVTYYQRTAADPTITVNGQPFTTGSKYSGIGQIEITYQYERKTASITIVKMDADTRKEINREQVFNGLSVGENHAFTDNLTVTSPSGYTAESGNPTSAFLADSNGAEVVFWYRQNQDSRYVNITVNLTCEGKVFETYTVRAIKGQETTVGRPSWTGYTPVQSEQGYQTVTPTGDNTVVEFKYTLDDPKTITIKLHNNTNDTDMSVPAGYTDKYTLKNGDEITIQAPIMSGFTLSGYTITGGTPGTDQFVKVSHNGIANGAVITFKYESVENSSFVKHTVRFVDHADKELYSYNKMIPKGTGAGTKVEYKESDVKYLIPGYTLANISYKVAGNDATDAQVTNMVDAEITYHFAEATAKIVVEQYNGGTKLSGDVELTGYRIGQENIVVTAPARTDVALKDTLTKKVPGPLTATQTVKFEYEALGNIQFWLYDAETGKLITVLNGEGGKTYTAGQDILNLSGDHYTYKADDRASDDFKTTGNGSVSTPVSGTDVKYSVYFQKATRQVTYIAMDSTKLSQNDFATATPEQKESAKIIGIQAAAMPAARVGETYMATAQTFDGWTLDDDLTKPYTVANEPGNLEVYFWYKAKATGTVTVNYVCGTEGGGANNFTLASYTTKAAGGEKLTVTPPQNLGDGRYTLNAGQKEQVIDVTRDGQHTVSFYYTKNFVTVNTKIVLGTAQPSEITSQDVLKTGTADFYPPYRPGYKLVGVTGVDGGTATKLPDGFNDKVTISKPQNDVKLVWYYEQTDATEYQSVITVKYIYRSLALSKETAVKVFIGVDNTIEIPTFDGYTAKSYTFNNGVSTDITDASKGITVKPTEKTATLSITYERTDGSIVLPGKDDEIAPPKDKDNVTVTPDDVDKPLIDNGDQGVKVPDNSTATVTRPKNPDQLDKGKEDITVPGGSVVKPDGTIVLPNPDGGEIGPNGKIPENLPSGYVAITYDSNNGTGEVKKEIGKKGELKVAGSLFTHPTNANFEGWNDSGLGSGTAYAKDKTVKTSITLYAKWSANYKYLATITYKPNGGTPDKDMLQNVGHDTDPNLKATLQSNTFQISGWLFGGWNEAANGTNTLYQPNAILSLSHQDAKEFYAQWYKVNADGSITVPGEDGNPKNEDTNATAKGNGTDAPTRNDKGEIEVPKGGSVTLPDGSVIGMPDGGKLLPNGTVIINRPDKDGNGKTDDGTITIPGKTDPAKPDVTDKDGQPEADAKVIELVYQINNGENVPDVTVKVVKGDSVSILANPFTWTGYQFVNWMGTDDKVYAPNDKYVAGDQDLELHAQWTKQNDDGSIELPGKDGSMTTPEDNVLVTPDKPNGTVTKQPDSSVKVEGNSGTVNRPKDPDHLDQGKENIKVPDGTIVKPDGTIILPDNGGTINPGNKLPGSTPTDYISVVYKANGGTGDDVIDLIKKGQPINAIKNPFTKNGETFSGWNTAENGINGTAYAEDAAITIPNNGKTITLYAQWSKATYKHSAKITYQANDGKTNAIEDTVGANDSTKFSTNLRSNPFSVSGWDFGGWNTKANGTGTLKAANAVVEVEAGKDQTWYAQWYKVGANGSITVPGDGNPNTTGDNVTANGTGVTRDPDTGNISIPAGGNVVKGNETIALPNGGTLKPDGSLSINKPNGGTIDVDKDGNTDPNANAVVLTYEANNGTNDTRKVYATKGEAIAPLAADTFSYSGHTFLYWKSGNDIVKTTDTITPTDAMTLSAVWAKNNPDGSIELPGKDGELESPKDKDNVIVTPDKPNGTLDGPKADGSVEVKGDEATVTRPDPANPDSKEDIKVPEGTVVEPDGTIKLPDGTEIGPDDRIPDDVTLTDYYVVTYEPGEGSGDVIRQIVEKDTDTTLLGADTFTAPNSKTFDGWLDELDSKHDADSQVAVSKNTTLTAQWKDSTPTPPAPKYSADIVFDPNTGDATATQTVTSADSTTITRNLDAYTQHFTAPADWTFMGWSTTQAASQSSSFYADGAEVTLKDEETLPLYAILYKLDADTKVITLPGKGGQPEGGDDVTVTPGAGADLTVDKGFIKAPAGSEIKQPANATPIKVIEGEVNVYPDGTVYVPEGSKVQLPDGSEIKGETTVDPDGNPDVDNTKPVQKPDGTIVLPGQNGVIGTGNDDITIAPAGPNKPAGRIDEDGNVTITNPSGADVNIPGSNPADFKVPNGTVIKPNGDMTLLYTIRYVDGSGTEIKTATVKPVQRGVPEKVEAATISGYTLSGAATQTASGEVSANLADYVITFTYTKNSTGGNTGGGGGGGSSSSTVSSYTIKASAGNGGIISPSGNVTVARGKDQTFSINPINGYRISDVIVDGKSVGAVSTYTFDSVKANHTIQVKFVKYNSIVADPEVTGVAGWLQTKEHNGYMGGYGNGLFGPNDNMTRAQAAQMFYNLLLNKNVDITVDFTDVPADAWYGNAVRTLASLGVIKGIGNDQFAPNRTITRAEFTVIAMRFANVSADVTNPFTDIATNDWYYTAVTSAVSYGWINGYSDGSFRPQATITRAEVVTIVNRMLNRTADRNFVDSNATAQFDDVPNTYWAYYNIMEATIAHDHSIDNDGVESWGKLK